MDVSVVGPAGSYAGVGARVGSTFYYGAAYGSLLTSATDGDAVIQTRSASGLSEKMRIDSSGSVGIGTASPQFALDVQRTDGSVQLKMGRLNSNIGSTWMGSDGGGFYLGVGTYAGAGGTVASPNGFTIDTSIRPHAQVEPATI